MSQDRKSRTGTASVRSAVKTLLESSPAFSSSDKKRVSTPAGGKKAGRSPGLRGAKSR